MIGNALDLWLSAQPGGILPNQISDLVLWLRGDLGVTIASGPGLTAPDDFTNAAWTKTNVTATADVDGNYDRLTETVTTAVHTVSQTPANLGSGTTVTYGIDAEPGSLATARDWIYLEGNGGTSRVWFDLTNGVLGTQTAATGTITALGGGKFRCTMTFTRTSGALVCGLATGNNVTSYMGVITADVRVANATVAEVQSRVSGWADQSGAANDFAQATPADQPIQVLSAINGLPAVKGTVANSHLERAGVSPGSAMTLFMVLERPSLATAYVSSDAGAANGVIANFSGGLVEWFNGGGTDRRTFANTPTGYHILEVSQTDGAALQGWWDGASVFGPVVPNAANDDIAALFGRTTGTSGGNAGLAEVIFYNRALTAAERDQLRRYLGLRYGIAIS